MTHLNIQQGLNVEVVTTLIIKKLYEAALSVPEPLEGELDAAYMSGNLLVDKSYRALVEYLTNRFDDLHINVTAGYYIPFEDSAVLNVLLANNIGSDGIGVTEAEAANATLTSAMFKNNTDITSFDEFKYFTKTNTNPPNLLFMGCSNLSSVDLSNVTTLSSEEFRGTAITSILDSGSITSIPQNCFAECTSLTSFTDFSNITSIGGGAFSNTKITGDLSIPNLTGTLDNNTFKNTNITSISDLGSITGISLNARFGYGEGAFNGCNILTTVTLPSTLTSISSGFDGCTSLTTINGNLLNLTSLINAAFSNTKISSIPNMTGLLTIGSYVFAKCSLLSVAVNCPNLTSLGNRAFWSSGITSVVNLGSVASIPQNCFDSCTSLTSVTLPSTCLTINGGAFGNCPSLTTLNAQNVKTIDGLYSLSSVAVSNLALPAIETIGQRSLSGAHIGILDLGPNLSSIGVQAFWDGTYSTFIFRGTTVPSANDDKFLYNMNNVIIYVPESALSDYQTAWPQMASNMVKIEGSIYDTQS